MKLSHVLNFSLHFSFGNKSFHFTILILRLWEKLTWVLTYFDQFKTNKDAQIAS